MRAATHLSLEEHMRTTALLSSLLAVAACGDSSPMTMSTSMDPPPPANGYQIKTPDFTLAAGQEEYLCYAVTLTNDADIAVTAFDSFAAASVHHFEVFQALAEEPEGLHDCGGAVIKDTWLPLFGGGASAGGLKLPDGAGFVLPAGTQLLLQLHLLDATPKPVTEHVVVNMTYAPDASSVTRAGIYVFGSMHIDLMPGQQGVTVQSAACPMPKDMHVFAVQPHMHQLGTKISLATGSDAGSMTTTYKRDPWVFGVQPIDPFPLELKKGEYGQATCVYDNTTDHEVKYGESTKDEMCYFVVFYTPFTSIDACFGN